MWWALKHNSSLPHPKGQNTDFNSLFTDDGWNHTHRPLLIMVVEKFKKYARKIHGCEAACRNTASVELTRGRVRYDALPPLKNFYEDIVSVVRWDVGHGGALVVMRKEGLDAMSLYLSYNLELNTRPKLLYCSVSSEVVRVQQLHTGIRVKY